jgi:hypothetical protein
VPQQVIARQELELWLSQRVKFHTEHREDLRTVLKKYVNCGKPVDNAAEDAVPTSSWNETAEDVKRIAAELMPVADVLAGQG